MKELCVWFIEQRKKKAFNVLVAGLFTVSVLFAWEFHWLQYGFLKSVRYLIILWGLTATAWTDIQEKRISNQVLIALLVIRSILLILEMLFYPVYSVSFLITFLGGFSLGGGMFLICYLVSRGSMGAGDVKLMAVMGYYLGMNGVFTAAFFSVFCAALYSILLLALRKVRLKEELPFAPFVLIGVITTLGLGV